MKAVDSATMRDIDRFAVKDFAMKGLQLMENAGRAVAVFIGKEFFPAGFDKKRDLSVALVAGKGNNGGDAFVAARHLENMGIGADVFCLAAPGDYKGDAAINKKIWLEMGGELYPILTKKDLKKHDSRLLHSSIIVDAIFGTGLNSEVKGIHAEVIEFINATGAKVVSIDVPSGIDASTGQVLGTAVKAFATVTMALPKTGFFQFPGSLHAGRVEVADIGVPRELLVDEGIQWNITDPAYLRRVLKARERDSHKGTYGHVAVLSGSPGKTGAVFMAAAASMRAGAGLVTIGLPETLAPIMAAKTTEVMTHALPETADKTLGAESYDQVKALLSGKSAVVTGPGLGISAGVLRFMEKLLRGECPPLVIDADGLTVLAGHLSVVKESGKEIVLTPHPGEAARLLGVSVEDVQGDRFGAATELSETSGAVVVLKGAYTVIAGKKGVCYINPTGNPGLATAGTGDVLAGMIGGFLAQGHKPLEAAVTAAYIHGLAADRVAEVSGEAGMTATDLLGHIPAVRNSFIS
ncbi:MAG: NAD(P)H-hydrate dehydratase [Thermodesulfobacteriota bacterium]|nr:MAG: NAD(P)H-hydrate dehydratase [Thermodesulfobacteriota bacterium]